MMKLEGLAAFVSVAETGSIGRAAKRLNLSTSVVSERLARLERDLYRPRFVRHRFEPYAARAAGGSCAARIAAGGWKPCRSISHVVL